MLDAARELFLEHGFGGTSVSEVVRRSGGSLATLYELFGSKEGLFEAIIADVSEQIVAPFGTPEFESRPLDEALRLFGERFLALVLEPEALRWNRMCIAEGPKYPELRAALVRTGPGHVNDRLTAYLAAQTKAGRLRIEDSRVAALHFLSLIKSETHFAAVCGEPLEAQPAEIARQVAQAVDVFLRGYAVHGRPGAPSRSQP
ncbi:MAG TPA: TetR/AcrR family transcriptional regulator [Thermoanaerobaculia bacterium]|nr:TetR/AcrR family transcriptional regulator [Thermoanaerobaculia bacterium]